MNTNWKLHQQVSTSNFLTKEIKSLKDKLTHQEVEINALHQSLEDLKMHLIANENHNSSIYASSCPTSKPLLDLNQPLEEAHSPPFLCSNIVNVSYFMGNFAKSTHVSLL